MEAGLWLSPRFDKALLVGGHRGAKFRALWHPSQNIRSAAGKIAPSSRRRAMAADRRLLKLHEALRRCSAPSNRVVTMVARVTPALAVGIRDLPALDRGARIPGGTVLPVWMDGAGTLEI